MTDKENRNTQTRFTGYLAKTIHNTRINYLKKKARIRQMEVNSDLSGIQKKVQDMFLAKLNMEGVGFELK